MAGVLPQIDREFLTKLVRGAEIIFHNAESLYFEADLLGKAGSTPRALCLHQISLEECSKLENIGAKVAGMLCGLDNDKNKFFAALARHSSKNKSNAYFFPASKAESEAKQRGDFEAAMAEFRKQQDEFHKQSNEAKNASLYADWVDGEFRSPFDRITLEMLAEIAERNREFLGIAQNNLNTLKRIEKSPDELQDLAVEFVEAMKKLREENPANFIKASKKILGNFLAKGLARRKRASAE